MGTARDESSSAAPAESFPFVHLRLHSEYSVSDGIVRIDEAVAHAAKDGMPALALTDLANLFGMVKFYEQARGRGVKPIVGADCWVQNEADREKPIRLLLLCTSRAGYLNISQLLSRAWLQNVHRGRAEIRMAWLAEQGTEGLIALSGASSGDVGKALLADNQPLAGSLAQAWQKLFPGRYYIELQRAGQANADLLIARSVGLAVNLGLPVVATHPVQFLNRGDFKAHEARVCIAQGHVLGDRRRPKAYTEEQYFKTRAEMERLFADVPQALRNASEIARRCSFELELGKSRLPRFPVPQGISLEAYLREQAEAGLHARLARLLPDAAMREAQVARYEARLMFELGTIEQMGFAGYFLIVADFINWARKNGIPVGPGRGSGAGSLVAFSLGITNLDPLQYDLLFERFLNPERVSMPDFDIDFCQEGRDRVIQYVRGRYGEESVSQIVTFGTMAARAVVRDCGRVLDLGYNFCDQIAKLIPVQPGKSITLRDAREMEPLLAERERNEDEVRELLDLGERLEGLTRNVGMHAGGVLIAPGRLTDFCPLYSTDGGKNVVSQLDKDDVEAVGLVKFDFLGLTTLTVLDWAERYIRGLGVADFSVEAIPLDDRDTYALLSAGNTTAVFQLESRGMRDLIKRARPDRFEDVIALVALYRPGPMDLIPDYIDRKHGRQRVEYLDSRLETILGPTYGIMVYQEQVMQIAQSIGGYTLGAADLLRRAMGKKKPEEMAQQRDIFVSGAEQNGLSKSKATQLFDLMEKFAGYGFNKSHAAAYALIAFHTAYLKVHYPAAFMASNLSAVMDDTDKVRMFHDDSLENGIKVLPPDVNCSDYRFVPEDGRTIRYGLGAVRGTGESAISGILQARKSGRFVDLFDFCRRVDKKIVNRRVVEALVRAGAFDSIDRDRARLLANVGRALDAAEQFERQATQNSLFGAEADPGAAAAMSLTQIQPWDLRRELLEEKTALGYCFSGHLFTVYEPELKELPRVPLAKLVAGDQRIWIAGVVAAARSQMTRRGKMMIVSLDDGSAQVDVSVFSEQFDKHRDKLKEDSLLIVQGKAQRDDFSGGLRITADDLLDIATLRERFAVRICLRMNGRADARRLRSILTPYRSSGEGACPVLVHYENGLANCEVLLGDDWRVRPDGQLLDQLAVWLRSENVQIVYGSMARARSVGAALQV